MRVGVDEAGRGPVLGPLVIAVVMVPEKDVDDLDEAGVTDSKDLTQTRRETLFETLVSSYPYRAVYVSPWQIDDAVRTEATSLTRLEHDVMAEMISGWDDEHEVIVDAPSETSPFDHDVVYEHGADEHYTVVGAASIVAKQLRDRAMHRAARRRGVDMGSGYPSDPQTQAYLATADLDDGMVRSSWQTVRDEQVRREQTSLVDYDHLG